jgi:uncharacterized protein (DUF1330 family)
MPASRHSRKSALNCQPEEWQAIAKSMAGRPHLMKDFMMEAFVVFAREETTDPDELTTYAAVVDPSFDGHDVTFLAAYGAMEHLEGLPFEGAVILRFPTMQAAHEWYHSPAYQAVAAHRFAGSRYRAFIVEGRQ